ncbi:hypothetical protein [Saccharopolyspora sp. 5N708]|uniref:hypothetical protein n=1 Tax=Saccharopolyspora sp. 5N708 TaxID=3457424 RepID=UPI003FD373DF
MEKGERPTTSNSIAGGALGPTVQAGSIQGGVHFHLIPRDGAVPVPDAADAGNDPLASHERADVDGPSAHPDDQSRVAVDLYRLQRCLVADLRRSQRPPGEPPYRRPPGFTGHTDFTRAFRTVYGTPPRDYRQQRLHTRS